MNMDTVLSFREIRDIPYRIPLAVAEPDDCCSGKAKRLLEALKAAGVEARYRVVTFRWSDVKLPESVAAVPHEDESTHVYLEVKVGDAWKIVDPTWDSGLRSIFAVNDWDGVSDTTIAVPVRETYSLEKSAEIMDKAGDADEIRADLEKNGAFYRAFNEWLESVRK